MTIDFLAQLAGYVFSPARIAAVVFLLRLAPRTIAMDFSRLAYSFFLFRGDFTCSQT